MKSIDVDEFRVRPGEDVDLSKRPTQVEPVYESKQDYRDLLADHKKQLRKLQYGFYAADTYALLLIFQAMDAAGKDGAISHVMSGINPQGCQVFSFKHPGPTELQHDFLWRTTACLPERGHIGIFNRSYYEEVLIVRVHPEILAAENIPAKLSQDHSLWQGRYQSILDHERYLHRNGTQVIKFFLHISPEEQRKRFLARIDHPKKNWKFSIDDVNERKRWDDYMDAYAKCLSATSTEHAPWYALPANDKKNARLLVSQVIVNALVALDARPPEVSEERKRELEVIRRELEAPVAADS